MKTHLEIGDKVEMLVSYGSKTTLTVTGINGTKASVDKDTFGYPLFLHSKLKDGKPQWHRDTFSESGKKNHPVKLVFMTHHVVVKNGKATVEESENFSVGDVKGSVFGSSLKKTADDYAKRYNSGGKHPLMLDDNFTA